MRLKSILVIFILIFSLYSLTPNAIIDSLEGEENINYSSKNLDGQIGSLVFGWAVTGENNNAVQSDTLNDFDIDSNGDIYAVGTFSHTEEFGDSTVTSLGGNDGYLVKISEEGDWGAVKTFSSSNDFSLEKVSVNNVGEIAIAGHFSDSTMNCDDLSIDNNDVDGGSIDIFIAVLDSNFNCLWLSSIGGQESDLVNELILNSDGTVLMGGMIQDIVYFGTQGTDGTAEDGFVCKFTNQGDLNWGHRINGINDQSVNTILENSDGSILVGGDSDNKAEINGGGENKSSNQAGFVLKLDSMANVDSLVPIPGVVIEIEKNPINSDIFIAGTFSGAKTFGDISATSMGYRDGYVSKYIFPGDFSNFNQASSSDVVDLYSMNFDSDGQILVSGSWGKLFDDYELELGTLSIDSSDYIDAFIGSLDPYGDWTWAIRGTSDRDDIAKKALVDSKGSLIIGGTFAISHENEVENAVPDGLNFLDTTLEPSSRQSHMYVWKLLVDTDMDGIGSMLDDCEGGQTGWTSMPTNDRDSDGCRDSDEDADDDNDGISDNSDSCPKGEINWVSDISTDPDGDGCRIDLEGPFLPGDLDSDGVSDEFDTDRNSAVKGISLVDPALGGIIQIEDLPVNATLNRTDFIDTPLLYLLGDDDGSNVDLDSAWFDVDGDGDYDFLRSGEIFRTINGELEQTASMNYCVGNDCDGPISVGDINGDGKLDLVDSHGVHLNLGNGFSSSVDWMPDETCSGDLDYIVSEVSLGDLDGDNKADLYLAFQGDDDCIYYTSTASDGALFGDTAQNMEKLGTTTSVKIIDFNLDGNNDVVRLIKSSYLEVIFNSGTSQPISSSVNYQTPPIQSGQAIDVGDLDLDGDPDILVATSHDKPDRIYLNNETNGKHNMTLEWTTYGDTYSTNAKIADIDGDGDLDFSLGDLVYLTTSSADTYNGDVDRDGTVDVVDNCIIHRNYFTNPIIDLDGDGCHDFLDDDDDDNDGVLDVEDNCPSGITGWAFTANLDLDGDGCLAEEDLDDDGDGVLDVDDICPNTRQSDVWQVDTEGVEYDSEGVPSEEGSELGCHPGESDKDHDGVEDIADLLPTDNTQHSDLDGDGFYDNPPPATLGDDCPIKDGTSTIDKQGCPDYDNDGWSDEGDKFPFDPNKWADPTDDSDFDTIMDVEDDCPIDAGSSSEDRQGCPDTDNDGWSNPDDLWLIEDGADAFPDDPNRHLPEGNDDNNDEGDGNNDTNGTGNGTGNNGENMAIDTSSDNMMYVYIGAGILVFLLLLVFVIWMLRGRDDDDDEYRDDYAEELLSDEEVVGGMFRKKKRKKQMDDHGYASQKAQVEFGQRPGARPQMQSGRQRQMQDTGYYGEESRHDSYYGGSGGSANVGSGYTPTTDMRGKIGDDGYEWLEFPEKSDQWWWRERNGDTWSPWE